MTGILLAISNLIPELTTTILSFMRHGVKMTEFGVACNLGSACFTITIVPAVAFLLTQPSSNSKGSYETPIKVRAEKSELSLAMFIRDLSFFLGSLIMYNIFLRRGVIHLSEALFLSALMFLYIYFIIKMNKANSYKQF